MDVEEICATGSPWNGGRPDVGMGRYVKRWGGGTRWESAQNGKSVRDWDCLRNGKGNE